MRIALPKGRLLDPLLRLLKARGIHVAFLGDRDYRPTTNLADVTAKLIKPRAIPQLLALNMFQVGFTCLDVVEEAGYEQIVSRVRLGISRVRIVAAVHRTTPDLLDRPPARPLRIATEYPNLADRWAHKRNLAHITIHTTGATEAYPPEDADIVVDVVETGNSLRANGLIEIETLLESETCAIVNCAAPASRELDAFIARLGKEGI